MYDQLLRFLFPRKYLLEEIAATAKKSLELSQQSLDLQRDLLNNLLATDRDLLASHRELVAIHRELTGHTRDQLGVSHHLLNRTERILDANHDLIRAHKRSLAEIKRAALGRKPLFQKHLDMLEDEKKFDPKTFSLSHDFERISRQLRPEITGHDPTKPTIATVLIGDEFKNAVAPCTKTKFDYCKKHGYNLAILEKPAPSFDRPLAWLKVPLCNHLMTLGHQKIFYLDADIIITNPSQPLDGFFGNLETSGRHMLIAEDSNEINTGSFFLRNTWQARVLLDLLFQLEIDQDHAWWEQHALVQLFNHFAITKSMVLIERNARLFNSMPSNPDLPDQYAWKPGDFVCHLAGYREAPKLAAKIEELLKQINPPSA